MTALPSREHIVLAARARRLVREATNEIARAVHLRIARAHEARVGASPRTRVMRERWPLRDDEVIALSPRLCRVAAEYCAQRKD